MGSRCRCNTKDQLRPVTSQRFAGATGSTSPPRGCSSWLAWPWSADDAERLDLQARQHLDLVDRGRAGPEHRPASPGLQGWLSDQEASPRRPIGDAGGPAVRNVRGAVQADGPRLPAGGVAAGQPAAAVSALLVRQLHDLHQDRRRTPARGHRAAAAHPSNLGAFTARSLRTPDGTAWAWPPRRCGTSTRCCTGP
jgi:hypothetical protein